VFLFLSRDYFRFFFFFSVTLCERRNIVVLSLAGWAWERGSRSPPRRLKPHSLLIERALNEQTDRKELKRPTPQTPPINILRRSPSRARIRQHCFGGQNTKMFFFLPEGGSESVNCLLEGVKLRLDSCRTTPPLNPEKLSFPSCCSVNDIFGQSGEERRRAEQTSSASEEKLFLSDKTN